MGNDPLKYIHYNINENHKNKVLTNEEIQGLKNLFHHFSNKSNLITKEIFNQMIHLDDEKMLNKIFKIFKSQRDKMYFDDIIYFYIAFADEDLKYILLAFLILEKEEKVDKKTYGANLSDFFMIDNNFKILNDDKILKYISYKKEKSSGYFTDFNFRFNFKSNEDVEEEEYIYKKNLIKLLSNKIFKEMEDIQKNISFFHKIRPSSKLSLKKRNTEKHYVCDCLKMKSNSTESDIPKSSFEKSFLNDVLVIDGHLPFTNFEKMMKEFYVAQNLIDLIIKYLKSYTMKESINFNDFKELLLYVHDINNNNKKKEFLFNMILIIYNRKKSIKGNQLKELLKIEDNECKLKDEIDHDAFEKIKEWNITSKISEYIGYMDNLCLIPYIRFNMKTEDENLKKKIIKFILNEKTVEEYLKDNFDKCNKFYPININFWNSLIDFKEQKNEQEKIELKINNKLIAEKDEIYYKTKKNNE